MWPHAHVNVFALLIEGNTLRGIQITDMLYLIRFTTLFHELNGLVTRKLKRLDFEILFGNLFHLGFKSRKVLRVDLGITKVNVIIKAVFGGRTIGKLCFRIQTLDSLS